jgi:chromosome segregation ATPase
VAGELVIARVDIAKVLTDLGLQDATDAAAARATLLEKQAALKARLDKKERSLERLTAEESDLDSSDEEYVNRGRQKLEALKREVAAYDDKVSKLDAALGKEADAAKGLSDAHAEHKAAMAWLQDVQDRATNALQKYFWLREQARN